MISTFKNMAKWSFNEDTIPYWFLTSIIAIISSSTFTWWLVVSLIGVFVIHGAAWLGAKLGDKISEGLNKKIALNDLNNSKQPARR